MRTQTSVNVVALAVNCHFLPSAGERDGRVPGDAPRVSRTPGVGLGDQAIGGMAAGKRISTVRGDRP